MWNNAIEDAFDGPPMYFHPHYSRALWFDLQLIVIASSIYLLMAFFSWLPELSLSAFSMSWMTGHMPRGRLQFLMDRSWCINTPVCFPLDGITLLFESANEEIRDVGSIPRPGRSPGNPLQYSCWENLMDRGTWQATVYRVAKSWTRLKQLSMQAPPTPAIPLFDNKVLLAAFSSQSTLPLATGVSQTRLPTGEAKLRQSPGQRTFLNKQLVYKI